MVKRFYNRVIYSRVSRRWIRELGPETLDAVEVSGRRMSNMPFRSHRTFSYPDYDICNGPYREETGELVKCDIVLAEQVWEHLDRPYGATRHVLEMLRPGGYFWVAAPFFAKKHDLPVDCSRWTARGLKNLLIEAGFPEKGIRAQEWGNRDCATRDMEGGMGKWAEFDPETDSLENDPKFPVMSWALARAPL